MLARIDWLLLALSAAPDGWMSPVQIQKTMFLFGQEAGDALGDDYYIFRPYRYGPFDAAIYRDIEYLESRDLVRIERLNGRAIRRFVITSEGCMEAREGRREGEEKLRDHLVSLVGWVKRQSFSDLLRNVCARYPQYAKNSVFQRESLRDIAVGMDSAFDLFQQPVRHTRPWYWDWRALRGDFDAVGRDMRRAMGVTDVQERHSNARRR